MHVQSSLKEKVRDGGHLEEIHCEPSYTCEADLNNWCSALDSEENLHIART